MRTVVVEIITVGEELSALGDAVVPLLEKQLKDPESFLRMQQDLKYHPSTGKIAVLVMLDVERDRMCVFFDDQKNGIKRFRHKNAFFTPAREPEIVRHFWNRIRRYDRFVTFNGRSFACPFIMLRSAAYGIACQRNLMPYRYSHKEHVDLCDQLAFYGAAGKKSSLAIWCRMFGLPDPGQCDDIYTYDYSALFHQCMRRAFLIRSLFWIWQDTLSF